MQAHRQMNGIKVTPDYIDCGLCKTRVDLGNMYHEETYRLGSTILCGFQCFDMWRDMMLEAGWDGNSVWTGRNGTKKQPKLDKQHKVRFTRLGFKFAI